MNILLAYHRPAWNKCGYEFERFFGNRDHVRAWDLSQSPEWRKTLGMYHPMGVPDSIGNAKQAWHGFDADCYIEMDGPGLRRLCHHRDKTRRTLWVLDVYRKEKLDFYRTWADHYDEVWCAHNDLCGAFKKARWLPHAWNGLGGERSASDHRPIDVSAVGNASGDMYSERRKLIIALECEGLSLFFSEGLYGRSMRTVYGVSKMVFNKSVAGEINLRIFEALGSGALLITDRLPKEAKLNELFQDGKHLVMYDSRKDLIEKVRHYLKHEDERIKIAEAGRGEVENHLYSNRFKTMLGR